MAPKLDCKKTFQMVSHKVGLTASILDKIKIDFSLSSEKIAVLNDWTSWALARMYQECDLYRSAMGTPQAPDAYKRYTAELDKLDAWVEDIASVLGEWGALVQNSTPKSDAKADGKDKDKSADKDKDKSSATDKGKAKADIEKTIDKHASDKEKAAHPTSLKPVSHDGKSLTAMLEELQAFPSKTDPESELA